MPAGRPRGNDALGAARKKEMKEMTTVFVLGGSPTVSSQSTAIVDHIGHGVRAKGFSAAVTLVREFPAEELVSGEPKSNAFLQAAATLEGTQEWSSSARRTRRRSRDCSKSTSTPSPRRPWPERPYPPDHDRRHPDTPPRARLCAEAGVVRPGSATHPCRGVCDRRANREAGGGGFNLDQDLRGRLDRSLAELLSTFAR